MPALLATKFSHLTDAEIVAEAERLHDDLTTTDLERELTSRLDDALETLSGYEGYSVDEVECALRFEKAAKDVEIEDPEILRSTLSMLGYFDDLEALAILAPLAKGTSSDDIVADLELAARFKTIIEDHDGLSDIFTQLAALIKAQE